MLTIQYTYKKKKSKKTDELKKKSVNSDKSDKNCNDRQNIKSISNIHEQEIMTKRIQFMMI